MQTVQQNPHLYQQAMNMMQGGGLGAQNMPNSTPTQASFGGNIPSTSTSQGSDDFPELKHISKLKSEGNDYFNTSKYEEAGSKYLYAIVDIESLRLKLNNSHTSNQKFLKVLNDLEISCRNNYCAAKVKLEEFDLLIKHAERVLELDQPNGKAHFNLAQAHAALRDPKKASLHITEALKVINSPQILALQTKIQSMLSPSDSRQETDSQFSSKLNNPEEIKIDSPSQNEFKVIDSEDSNKKSIETEVVNPLPSNTSPISPPQEKLETEDFPIKEEGSFEDLEKYFRQENNSTKEGEHCSEPCVSEPPEPQKTEHKASKASNEPTHLINKEAPLSQASFFEKYWQVLLGILLGLIIAKVLKV